MSDNIKVHSLGLFAVLCWFLPPRCGLTEYMQGGISMLGWIAFVWWGALVWDLVNAAWNYRLLGFDTPWMNFVLVLPAWGKERPYRAGWGFAVDWPRRGQKARGRKCWGCLTDIGFKTSEGELQP